MIFSLLHILSITCYLFKKSINSSKLNLNILKIFSSLFEICNFKVKSKLFLVICLGCFSLTPWSQGGIGMKIIIIIKEL